MKLLPLAFAVAACLAFTNSAFATDHYVSGHTTKTGTYVAPHYQSNPNSTRNDNYSTRGNTNPYTGQAGTKPRDEDAYGTPSKKKSSSDAAESADANDSNN